VARRFGIGDDALRRQLALGRSEAFERSEIYMRVFADAERLSGKRLPRAALPQIVLSSPKITRRLTTEWFARRVEARFEQCLQRERAPS
jgi:hypothetical protein